MVTARERGGLNDNLPYSAKDFHRMTISSEIDDFRSAYYIIIFCPSIDRKLSSHGRLEDERIAADNL
jgi:hypothetical protein